MVATLAAVACAEPSYGMATDASTAASGAQDGRTSQRPSTETGVARRDVPDAAFVAPEVDADVAPTPAQDAGQAPWWAPLAAHEHYAMRTHFFARDRGFGDNLAYSHEILFWAKLKVDPATDSVSMALRRCVDHGVITTTLTLRDDFAWTNAARLPPEQHTLVLRDGKIRSESATRTLGYEPTQPDDCTPGARIAARPGQAWLKDGKCECRSEPLPILATDCRVTDVDGDGQPGLAIRHTGITNMVEAARVKDGCQIDDGVLAADGSMRAIYLQNYDVLDLSCGAQQCSHNDVAGCPRELNKVWFEPLPDAPPSGKPWDCAEVVVEAERVLPSEMLGFPVTGC
ncbi:MAG: hypothetical protein RLZZ450_7609 [Pseudomonadota bacterium]